MLYRPLPLPASDAAAQEVPDNDKSPLAGELLCIVAIGSGINICEQTAPNSLATTVIEASIANVRHLFRSEDDSNFSLELVIRFMKPLMAPGIYMTRSWLQRRTKGRKAWIQSVILDGNNNVLAEADALFVDVSGAAKL